MSRTVITAERPMVPCPHPDAESCDKPGCVGLGRPARGPRPCVDPKCNHIHGSSSPYGPPNCTSQIFDIYDAPCGACLDTAGDPVGAIWTQTADGWENQPCEVCNGSHAVPARVDAEPIEQHSPDDRPTRTWHTEVTDINEESP